MLTVLLSAALAATPAPRPLPAAEPAIYFPRLDQLSGVLAFLGHAGTYSVMLRPSSWRDEFLPLLQVDPTRPESLTAAGIDPSGGATVNMLGDTQVTCVLLKDPKAFEARAARAMAGRGEPWTSKAQGAALVGLKSGKSVAGGYALKGGEACVAEGSGSETALRDAAKLLAKPSVVPAWKALSALPGAAYVMTARAALALDGDADSLHAEGRGTRLPLPPLRAGSESPYGGMAPSGLLFARARLEPSAYPQALGALEDQVARACPGCDRSKMAELARALEKHLTGHVLIRVDRVQPATSLRTAPGRYFAVKHVLLAEVLRPNEARAALDAVAGWGNAKKTDAGYVLALPEGEIELGVRGSHLYLGNDAEATRAALEGLGAKPAKLAHGAEFFIEPRKVSKALARIPLMDALSSRDLAGLLALSTELGPLLGASDSVTGWIDSAGVGAHRFFALWKLPAVAR